MPRKQSQIMLRRSAITIWPNNLQGKWREWIQDSEAVNDGHESLMRRYFDYLVKKDWKKSKYTGVALALEVGEKNQGVHIQGYVESSQKRLTTFGKDFSVMSMCFEVVRSARGAYAYCTGTGVHQGKFALDRFQFGEFKLHGDDQKADLKMLVNLALEGCTASEIFHEYPYAWCVHRDRMLKFMEDMRAYRKRKPTTMPKDRVVGFSSSASEEKKGQ